MKNFTQYSLLLLLVSYSTVLANVVQVNNHITLETHWLSSAHVTKQVKSINPINNIRINNQYKALKLSITNKSTKNYLLSRKNISVPFENPHIIKKKLNVITSLFPIISGIAMSTLLISVIGLATVPSIAAGLLVGITTSSIDTQSVNKKTGHTLHNKSIDLFHPIVIESCSSVKKIIFIKKKNVKNKITIALQSCTDDEKITFTINIP